MTSLAIFRYRNPDDRDSDAHTLSTIGRTKCVGDRVLVELPSGEEPAGLKLLEELQPRQEVQLVVASNSGLDDWFPAFNKMRGPYAGPSAMADVIAYSWPVGPDDDPDVMDMVSVVAESAESASKMLRALLDGTAQKDASRLDGPGVWSWNYAPSTLEAAQLVKYPDFVF